VPADGAPVRRSARLAVVVVAIVVVAVGLRIVTADDRIPLGDRGRVNATLEQECRFVHIEHDGLALEGHEPEEPLAWWDGTVPGRLVLDGRGRDDVVTGTFTTDDGRVVEVRGGRAGEYLLSGGCPFGRAGRYRPPR
jgi:hypothetical protein